MGAISSPDRSKIVQVVTAAIAAATGTTTIPDDATAPLIGEGTQIASLAITPVSASNTVRLRGMFCFELVNKAADADMIILSVFRGSTLVGSARVFADVSDFSNIGGVASFEFVDSPASIAGLTYSVRVGMKSSAFSSSWCVNRSASSASALGSSMPNYRFTAEELRA